MSDVIPPDRDETGRFVSAKRSDMPADDRANWHPLARSLFGWTTGAKISGLFFWGTVLLAALLIPGDLFISHKAKFDIQKVFGFYGFLGFLAFALVILAGWLLGYLLRRDEDHYGDAESALERSRREEG